MSMQERPRPERQPQGEKLPAGWIIVNGDAVPMGALQRAIHEARLRGMSWERWEREIAQGIPQEELSPFLHREVEAIRQDGIQNIAYILNQLTDIVDPVLNPGIKARDLMKDPSPFRIDQDVRDKRSKKKSVSETEERYRQEAHDKRQKLHDKRQKSYDSLIPKDTAREREEIEKRRAKALWEALKSPHLIKTLQERMTAAEFFIFFESALMEQRIDTVEGRVSEGLGQTQKTLVEVQDAQAEIRQKIAEAGVVFDGKVQEASGHADAAKEAKTGAEDAAAAAAGSERASETSSRNSATSAEESATSARAAAGSATSATEDALNTAEERRLMNEDFRNQKDWIKRVLIGTGISGGVFLAALIALLISANNANNKAQYIIDNPPQFPPEINLKIVPTLNGTPVIKGILPTPTPTQTK